MKKILINKVDEKAKIRIRYNRNPNSVEDTNGEMNANTKHKSRQHTWGTKRTTTVKIMFIKLAIIHLTFYQDGLKVSQLSDVFHPLSLKDTGNPSQVQLCFINTYEPGHETKCLMSYANNKGADQPAHPCSLICAFIIRCLDTVMSLVSVTKFSSLILASVAEQASLSLTWSEAPEDTLSHDEAHLIIIFERHHEKTVFVICKQQQRNAFVVRCLGSTIPLLAKPKVSRL